GATTEDLVIGEGQYGIGGRDSRSHADIGSIEKFSAPGWQCGLSIVGGIIRADKDLVEIAMGGASAAVNADLAGDVAATNVGLGGGIYYAELAGVGLAAIFRALHEDLRS